MVYFQLQAEGEEQDGEKGSGTPPVEPQVGPPVGPDEVPVVPPNDMPPAAIPKNRAKPKSPEQEEKENKASLGVILSTWSYTNNILFIFYITFFDCIILYIIIYDINMI